MREPKTGKASPFSWSWTILQGFADECLPLVRADRPTGRVHRRDSFKGILRRYSINYFMNEEWRMKNEERRTKNEERRTKNEERRTKNEERRTTNEERRTKNEEYRNQLVKGWDYFNVSLRENKEIREMQSAVFYVFQCKNAFQIKFQIIIIIIQKICSVHISTLLGAQGANPETPGQAPSLSQ